MKKKPWQNQYHTHLPSKTLSLLLFLDKSIKLETNGKFAMSLTHTFSEL